jgi:hypothetical protein
MSMKTLTTDFDGLIIFSRLGRSEDHQILRVRAHCARETTTPFVEHPFHCVPAQAGHAPAGFTLATKRRRSYRLPLQPARQLGPPPTRVARATPA